MRRLAFVLALAAVLASGRAAEATSFNIDFGTIAGNPGPGFGAAAGQAGVWNVITSVSTPLVDLAGGATGASIGILGPPAIFGSTGGGTNDGEYLMNDYVAQNVAGWQISIAGLTNGTYDVYLYDADGAQAAVEGNPTYTTGAGQINAAISTPFGPPAGAGYSGAFVQGGNYLFIPGIVVSGGTLVVYNDDAFVGFAGMQLVDNSEVPEPASILLMGSGLASAWFVKRRKKSQIAEC